MVKIYMVSVDIFLDLFGNCVNAQHLEDTHIHVKRYLCKRVLHKTPGAVIVSLFLLLPLSHERKGSKEGNQVVQRKPIRGLLGAHF